MALRPTPSFWDRRGWLSNSLLPLSHIYCAATRAWEAMQPAARRAPVPVVCVGAAVVGGAGKTPVAMALLERIVARSPSARVHFLTRGYGGRERGPLRVDPDVHTAERVSDEAMLLSRLAPTWVCADRWAGAVAACAASPPPTLLVMDDGLQHFRLRRDLSLLVVDADHLVGNGRVLPAGPLRAPLPRSVARADALIALSPICDAHSRPLAGPPPESWLRQALSLPASLPLLRARIQPEPDSARRLSGKRVVAFTGTARPDRFFRALRSLGCRVCATLPLPDHAPIPDDQLQSLCRLAEAEGALLVTTSKDAARTCPARMRGVAVLPVRVEWLGGDGDRLDAMIDHVIARCATMGGGAATGSAAGGAGRGASGT
jgi:tetraacyldisaccharide 4'-kinase